MSLFQTVRKWGNGTGVRLPKEVLIQARVELDQQVRIEVHNRTIVLTPIEKKPLLERMLQGVSPELVGSLVEWGEDIGAEIYE